MSGRSAGGRLPDPPRTEPDDQRWTAEDEAVVSLRAVTCRFGALRAVDEVDLTLRAHRIYGLLGRNGAGKTTLMQVVTGQRRPTGGSVRVFGADPYENDGVLARTCFVAEGQRYPEGYSVGHVLAAARMLNPRWDEAFARSLVEDFALPVRRPVKKLSRGTRSALGVVVGLAARAELTLFDEPYLGLDAVARQVFYDRLLADYAAHPRTVLLSTHLIDEVADLLEHVVLVDRGQVLLDEDAEELRRSAVSVSGPAGPVGAAVAGLPVLREDALAGVRRVLVRPGADQAWRAAAEAAGLALETVSLQQVVVGLTDHPAARTTGADDRPTPTEEVSR